MLAEQHFGALDGEACGVGFQREDGGAFGGGDFYVGGMLDFGGFFAGHGFDAFTIGFRVAAGLRFERLDFGGEIGEAGFGVAFFCFGFFAGARAFGDGGLNRFGAGTEIGAGF